MAEQHAVGGRQRQHVAAALLPGEMARARHQLARLDAAELGERAVGRLVAPDPLRGRVHRVAAVALLVLAVVLVAVDHHLVADLPAVDLGADRPDDARGVRAGDVVVGLVHVEHRDRLAERRPDAVVVDAGGHHQDQDLVAVERRRRHHLLLHRDRGLAVALAPDHPGVHVAGHVAERRDRADLVEVLAGWGGRGGDLGRRGLAGERDDLGAVVHGCALRIGVDAGERPRGALAVRRPGAGVGEEVRGRQTDTLALGNS